MDRKIVSTFKKIRETLKPYSPPLTVKVNIASKYDLYSVKNIVIRKKNKPEVFFAGVAIHRNFVGFYYMPIYTHPEVRNQLPPRLLAYVKGKACFHFKEVSDDLLSDIASALHVGFEKYQAEGWINT